MSTHLLLALAIWPAVALVVGIHASSRDRSGAVWGLGTLFTGVIGLVVYLIVLLTADERDDDPAQLRVCPGCSSSHAGRPDYCPDCGEALDESADVVSARILRSGSDGYCSNCKSQVDLDADACENCDGVF